MMMMWGLKKVIRIMLGDEEDDDDSSDCSEVSYSDFEENSDWTAWLESATFSQSTEATFDTNKVDSRNSDLANDDLADEDEYSDELNTPPGSEDKGILVLRCLKMMKM